MSYTYSSCPSVVAPLFSRNDQCYFDFNKVTGELLLHDISERKDTNLFDASEEHPVDRLQKTPRQCAVVLGPNLYPDPENPRDRRWIFRIREATFRLVPFRSRGDEAAFAQRRLAFAGQPDPERTFEGTIEQLVTLGLRSLGSGALTSTYMTQAPVNFNPHNTRFKTPLEPEADDAVQHTKLRPLGVGGQGVVHLVVDNHTGAHYACKFVAVRQEVPFWGIYSERDFRAKVEEEVNLVQSLRHVRPPCRIFDVFVPPSSS